MISWTGKGKKGSLVALIKGTDSEYVNSILKQIGTDVRRKVTDVTLDLAASMEKIVRRSFPKAQLVTDRFHVQKQVYDAVQEIGKPFKAHRLENGDTEKQLLARSRYLLF